MIQTSAVLTSLVVVEILFIPFLKAYLYVFPEITCLTFELAGCFAVESHHSRAVCVRNKSVFHCFG